jgi:hypothetical protein
VLSKTSPGVGVRQPARFAAGRRSARHSPRASNISTPRSVPAVGAPCAGMGAWMHSADQLPLRKRRMRARTSFFTCFLSKECGCLPQEKSLQMRLPLRKNP